MTACPHIRIRSTCTLCDGLEPAHVFVSEGGLCYHLYEACEALKRGQNKVVARGGVVGAVNLVSRRSTTAMARKRCRTCWRMWNSDLADLLGQAS